jgi:ABC-2 type transport system permease protein
MAVKASLSRFWAVVKKEIIQFVRERVVVAMMILMPLLQLTLFGYAINTEVRHLSLAVWDQSQSRLSREITASFVNSEFFDYKLHAGSMKEITQMIDRGDARAGLVFPPDLAESVNSGKPAEVLIIFDASDPMTAGNAMASAGSIGLYHSLRIMSARYFPGREVQMPIEIKPRAWYNPEMRSSNFMVPGLLGVILTILASMLTAMALVRERERGTLEQLLVSPIKQPELILGKIFPYFVMSFVATTLMLAAAHLLFGVAVKGSILLLGGVSLIYLFTTLSFGILISTVAKTQQSAMQMTFFSFLPQIMLSGFMFPIDSMPEIIRPICYAIPLTYYLQTARGIILKGIGAGELATQIWVIAAFGVGMIVIASLRLRKRLG